MILTFLSTACHFKNSNSRENENSLDPMTHWLGICRTTSSVLQLTYLLVSLGREPRIAHTRQRPSQEQADVSVPTKQ